LPGRIVSSSLTQDHEVTKQQKRIKTLEKDSCFSKKQNWLFSGEYTSDPHAKNLVQPAFKPRVVHVELVAEARK
jgi:hypothetical protein